MPHERLLCILVKSDVYSFAAYILLVTDFQVIVRQMLLLSCLKLATYKSVQLCFKLSFLIQLYFYIKVIKFIFLLKT
jgi:hypothetical protein